MVFSFKKSQLKKLGIISVVLIISLAVIVLAISITDNFNYPSPFVTSNSSQMFSYNISFANGENPNNITWNWDGVPYLMYDPSLVLFMNFDNRSSLGENDTNVADLSMYGNNGTVIGGENISWTPNGKYGGSFNFSGGNGAYINLSSNPININNNFTISFWLNVPTNLYNGQVLEFTTATANRIACSGSGSDNNIITCGVYNGTYNFKKSGSMNLNLWINVVYVYNLNVSGSLYINNIAQTGTISPSSGGSVGNMIGSRTNLASARFLNGSIDNFMVWNKTLSNLEIQQIYYSSLTKYYSQNWTFQTNQSLNYSASILNSSSLIKNNNYYLCSSNSSGSENCSSQKTIIECDGDFFHCNPNKYSAEDRIFKKGKTAKEIWERDDLRTKQLIEKGFNVIRLWENKINKMELNDFKEILCSN